MPRRLGLAVALAWACAAWAADLPRRLPPDQIPPGSVAIQWGDGGCAIAVPTRTPGGKLRYEVYVLEQPTGEAEELADCSSLLFDRVALARYRFRRDKKAKVGRKTLEQGREVCVDAKGRIGIARSFQECTQTWNRESQACDGPPHQALACLRAAEQRFHRCGDCPQP